MSLPFLCSPLEQHSKQIKQFPIHSVSTSSLANLVSRAVSSLSLQWKCSCQQTRFCLTQPLHILFSEGCSSLGLLDTIRSSWLSSIFIIFLIYFSFSTICLNQELPHRTIWTPYLSPPLPLRWSIHYHSFDQYLRDSNCKIHISSWDFSIRLKGHISNLSTVYLHLDASRPFQI